MKFNFENLENLGKDSEDSSAEEFFDADLQLRKMSGGPLAEDYPGSPLFKKGEFLKNREIMEEQRVLSFQEAEKLKEEIRKVNSQFNKEEVWDDEQYLHPNEEARLKKELSDKIEKLKKQLTNEENRAQIAKEERDSSLKNAKEESKKIDALLQNKLN